MRPGQTCRQCGRIVGDDQVTGKQQAHQGGTRPMLDGASTADQQQLRVRGPLNRLTGCDHAPSAKRTASISAVMAGSAAAIASANSRAANSGRFNDERSASGTAAACIAVSISPGSSEMRRIPEPDNS